jgi:hypothetical protein
MLRIGKKRYGCGLIGRFCRFEIGRMNNDGRNFCRQVDRSGRLLPI